MRQRSPFIVRERTKRNVSEPRGICLNHILNTSTVLLKQSSEKETIRHIDIYKLIYMYISSFETIKYIKNGSAKIHFPYFSFSQINCIIWFNKCLEKSLQYFAHRAFIHKGIWNLLDISERIFSRAKVYHHASGDILLPTRHVTSSANISTLFLSTLTDPDSQ